MSFRPTFRGWECRADELRGGDEREDVPTAGGIATIAQRAAAAADITRLTGDAGRVVRAAGNVRLAAQAGRPFELAGLSAPQLAEARSWMSRNLVWVNEFNCFNRATTGALHVAEATGARITPGRDAYAAGVAVLKYATPNGADFHAGLAVREAATGRTMVIDLLSSAEPMELGAWADHNEPGVASHDLRVLRPLEGTGVNGRATYVNHVGLGYVRDNLLDTWDHAADRWQVQLSGAATGAASVAPGAS